MISIIILSVCIPLIILMIIIGIRNELVYAARQRWLDEVFQDMTVYTPDRWRRLDVLNQVSYHKMVLMFWRPIDSFLVVPEDKRG